MINDREDKNRVDRFCSLHIKVPRKDKAIAMQINLRTQISLAEPQQFIRVGIC